MAEIITDPKQLKPRTAPLPPGLKPPVENFTYRDEGSVEDLENFLLALRKFRDEEKDS